MDFLAEILWNYGFFCAQHPWQVIFLVLTSTVGIISSQGMHTLNRTRGSLGSPQPQALDIILMTTVRAVAVLYSYHRLRSLHRSHSRFVLSLAGLFTVFSSFVFRNASEVASCISQGMAVLGPSITLDTLVETLVIGVGTLSGKFSTRLNIIYPLLYIFILWIRSAPFGSIVQLWLYVGRRQLCSVHDFLPSLSSPCVGG